MQAMNHQELERKSSAMTLSDMEIFVFPELVYSLLLANLMSPRLWRWRADPWFAGLETMTPYRRIVRLKQYPESVIEVKINFGNILTTC